jgi:hypothetical protein
MAPCDVVRRCFATWMGSSTSCLERSSTSLRGYVPLDKCSVTCGVVLCDVLLVFEH